jgi:hypothetical protein
MEAEAGAATNRLTFLKRVGGVLAVGLGIVGALPKRADAAIRCCYNYEYCATRAVCNRRTDYYYCETINCCTCVSGVQGCIYVGPVPC